MVLKKGKADPTEAQNWLYGAQRPHTCSNAVIDRSAGSHRKPVTSMHEARLHR
jgi:hypothetical protein